MEAIETYAHVLSVFWGTVLIILVGKLFIALSDRRQRNKYYAEMYESKICYTIKERDDSNIVVTFKDKQGYELLYNFLQSKKIIKRGCVE